jgi:hypothetical protein
MPTMNPSQPSSRLSCGGIPGYYTLLEATRDPQRPEHEDMLDWIGEEFDPEAFSVDEVNWRLAPLQRSYCEPETTQNAPQ